MSTWERERQREGKLLPDLFHTDTESHTHTHAHIQACSLSVCLWTKNAMKVTGNTPEWFLMIKEP